MKIIDKLLLITSDKKIHGGYILIYFYIDEIMGVGKLTDGIFGEKCEHNYIQPTFITDYPKEMSPLIKQHRDNPALIERFA